MSDMDRGKFKALVHYICARCDDPRKLGATKLNKIVWFAEKSAFLRFGAPLTGVKFTKLPHGPVPKAILPILEELENEKALFIRESHLYDYPKREYISLSEPDISAFTAPQISMVDAWIDEVCNRHTADSISNKTHDEIWDLAEIGEEIPLQAVLGMQGELTEEDIEWMRGEIENREVAA